MATLDRIRVHPVKSLDPADRQAVRISEAGGLAGDRALAIVDADGEYVNGKRTPAVHRLSAEVDPDGATVVLGGRDSDERQAFDLDRDRGALIDWLSAYFGFDVGLATGEGGELTDSRVLGGGVAGATVVSTATLEAVASWFPDLSVGSLRRRFRANLEVAGVEPFWEDRFAAGDAAGLRIGDVEFRGVKPVSRCVVPTRDPDTGEPTPGFRERLTTKREETLPPWADRSWFDHYYALTALVHPESAAGETIARGDPVRVLD